MNFNCTFYLCTIEVYSPWFLLARKTFINIGLELQHPLKLLWRVLKNKIFVIKYQIFLIKYSLYYNLVNYEKKPEYFLSFLCDLIHIQELVLCMQLKTNEHFC